MNRNWGQVYKLWVVSFSLVILMFASCKKDDARAPEAPVRPLTGSSSKYVTSLFEYRPAPGQFINTDVGDSTGALSILANKASLVSLGAWGGYNILGFDHTVINQSDTADIMIYANAFSTFAEPGIVWVMQDLNGNGKPDDIWYELAGSEYNQTGYKRDYSVTYQRPAATTDSIPWTDNLGDSGKVATNAFHTQAYYPEWLPASYTLSGSLLPHTNIDDSNPSYITSRSFPYGYADNTAGGDMVDIDNAVDGKGNKVSLRGIDFIKIQTGIQYNMGWLGELSTDIAGVADISMGLD